MRPAGLVDLHRPARGREGGQLASVRVPRVHRIGRLVDDRRNQRLTVVLNHPIVGFGIGCLELSQTGPIELPGVRGTGLLQSPLEERVRSFLKLGVHRGKLAAVRQGGNGNIVRGMGHT